MAKEKGPKIIWDNCKYIGEVKKTAGTKLVIELVSREGVKIVNVREWYFKKSTQEWKPSIKGFGLPITIPLDGEISNPAYQTIKLISDAINQSNDFALEDPENAVWSQS